MYVAGGLLVTQGQLGVRLSGLSRSGCVLERPPHPPHRRHVEALAFRPLRSALHLSIMGHLLRGGVMLVGTFRSGNAVTFSRCS